MSLVVFPFKHEHPEVLLHNVRVAAAHPRVHEVLCINTDITSFGPDWITKAEEAADFGYGLVRHYFLRASTDAMITWMITRTGFSLLWPHTEPSWIEQPLGSGLLMRRKWPPCFSNSGRPACSTTQ